MTQQLSPLARAIREMIWAEMGNASPQSVERAAKEFDVELRRVVAELIRSLNEPSE